MIIYSTNPNIPARISKIFRYFHDIKLFNYEESCQEAYFEACQVSKMEPLNIFSKSFILYV